MTRKIRREIAFLKSQDPVMNHDLWVSLTDALEKIADRIDQLEDEKTTKKGL